MVTLPIFKIRLQKYHLLHIFIAFFKVTKSKNKSKSENPFQNMTSQKIANINPPDSSGLPLILLTQIDFKFTHFCVVTQGLGTSDLYLFLKMNRITGLFIYWYDIKKCSRLQKLSSDDLTIVPTFICLDSTFIHLYIKSDIDNIEFFRVTQKRCQILPFTLKFKLSPQLCVRRGHP